MESRERRELQLLRISHGAHELTHMIHSWSTVPTIEGGAVHMASELLRGSLELQNSLQFLLELHGASSGMPIKNMRKRAKEKDEGEAVSKGTSTKKKSSVHCSKNSMEELKEVIRVRLCMQRRLSTKHAVENVSKAKKMKAPSLIGKLMGLEESTCQAEQIAMEKSNETMRCKGILSYDYFKHRPNFDPVHEVAPIVIMKSRNSPPWDGEKLTLAELFMEDKSFDAWKQSEVVRNVNCNSLKTRVSISLQEKKIIMDSRRSGEQKKQEILIQEPNEVKAIGTSVSTIYVKSTRPDKGKVSAKASIQTCKTMKSKNKEMDATKWTSLNSKRSLTREKFSKEKPVRSHIRAAKIDDKKSKDGKSSATQTSATTRNRSISPTNVLPNQEKKDRTNLDNKGKIIRDHKMVNDVTMPTKQALRNSRLLNQSSNVFNHISITSKESKSHCHLKHQPVCSQSTDKHSEVKGDHLLLDYAKELMDCKSHEGESSIKQMLQLHVRRRSRVLSSSHLLEKTGISMENFASKKDARNFISTKGNLYVMLENDLRCSGVMLNSTWDDGWNDWVRAQEADTIVVEVEEEIVSAILEEVAMDLVALV